MSQKNAAVRERPRGSRKKKASKPRVPGWVTVIVAAVGIFVGAFIWRGRGCGGSTTPAAAPGMIAAEGQLPAGERVDEARARSLLALASDVLGGADRQASGSGPDRRLAVLTVAQGQGAVLVSTGEGSTLEDAVVDAALRVKKSAKGTPVRLDVLESVDAEEGVTKDTRIELGNDVGLIGFFLPEWGAWLLPDEILAHGLFLEETGTVLPALLDGYAAALRGEGRGAPLSKLRRVRFGSFLARGDDVVRLYRGNPPRAKPAPDALLQAAEQAGDYLLRHQHADGSFDYLYRSATGSVGKGYNVLRHAGTCYALYDLAAATGRDELRAAADRGLGWLLSKHAVGRGADESILAIVDQDEAKLGGAALATLALVQAHRAGSFPEALETAKKLARYLLSQQEPSGNFIAKTTWSTGDPEAFESLYYPGEAIFALARLHDEDPKGEWLDAAVRAARYLVEVRDAGLQTSQLEHDHWLLMGFEELYEKTSGEMYLSHGQRIGDAILGGMQTGPYPDWDGGFYAPPRSTPASTRVEGLVALVRTLERARKPTDRYRAALERIVMFQQTCQITPENALYLPNPTAAWGGFKKSLTSFDVRIDYVQHAVSGMLGYRELLMK